MGQLNSLPSLWQTWAVSSPGKLMRAASIVIANAGQPDPSPADKLCCMPRPVGQHPLAASILGNEDRSPFGIGLRSVFGVGEPGILFMLVVWSWDRE